MTKIVKAITALLLLASPAASGGEFEQMFHEAYALEVVEGDVKGAAKVYMVLMRNEEAPEAVRYESKFRFAVCTVLLGRADEGRTHLAELIKDPKTPEGVRKKAEEYRAAVDGIGVGTELEKKLQSLVFDLGRVSPTEAVPAYRDFEIIGKPALPFLRKLLRHDDDKLRAHAFRLLCRMGEPGMAAEWQPSYASGGPSFNSDLTTYLGANPDELAAFEKRVLALGDEAAGKLAAMRPAPSFSLAFLGDLVAKKSGRGAALAFIGWAGEAEPRHAMISEWITGEDEDLSRATTLWLLSNVGKSPSDALATPEVFDAVIGRLTGDAFAYSPLMKSPNASGFQRLARARTGAEVLAALARAVRAEEERLELTNMNPLHWQLPKELAAVVDEKLSDGVDLKAYLALLDRWTAADRKLQAWFAKQGYSPRPVPDRAMITHFARAVRAMPEAEAVAEIRRLLDLYDPAGNLGSWESLFQPVDSAMRVRILAATVRSGAPGARPALIQLFPFMQGRETAGDDVANAQLGAVLDLIPILDMKTLRQLGHYYPRLALAVGPDDAVANLEAILGRLPDLEALTRHEILLLASGYRHRNQDYLSSIVRPAAARSWDLLRPKERQMILGQMLSAIQPQAPGSPGTGEGRELLGEFVRAHYTDLDQNLFSMVSRCPELFPPEEWIPLAPTNTRMFMGRDQAENDRIATALAKDVAAMNDAAIEFIGKFASPAIRTEVFERGLALTDRESRQRFTYRLSSMNGSPAGTDAIEKTLVTVLAEESPDLLEVSRLAKIVLALRPSEKLFPAASLLLASTDRNRILTGIHIAESLGREDLVADLGKLLDSMDSQVRTAAKKAIDSIQEVARIKREETMKKAGLIPK